ncbi:hypothetical protein QTN25_009892 [Entamoeba marina]
MPQTGILKRLKKFGKTVGNVLADLNDNIYKPLKPAIEGAINSIPLGGYINKGLEYGSNMLDTYVPYKQKNIKGRKPKNSYNIVVIMKMMRILITEMILQGIIIDYKMSILVFENLSDNILTFKSVAEFQKYYDKHKTEIDAMKTRGINAKYKIDGYKLGRKNNVLQFYPLNTVNDNTENVDIQESLDEIKHMLNHIMKNMVCKSDSKQLR